MEQREKLIELIGGIQYLGGLEGKLADHLLDNGVVVLPCKPGDTVYEVRNNTDACFLCPCYSDFYGQDAMCTREGEEIVDYPNLSEDPVCEKQYYEIVAFEVKNENQAWSIRKQIGKNAFLNINDAKSLLERKQGEANE